MRFVLQEDALTASGTVMSSAGAVCSALHWEESGPCGFYDTYTKRQGSYLVAELSIMSIFFFYTQKSSLFKAKISPKR